MGKGRKAIPADLKDNSTYKDPGAIKQQKDKTPKLKGPNPASLRCPGNLTDGAKKEWARVVGLYKQLDIQILNNLDIAVLTAYCIEVDITQRLYNEWISGSEKAAPCSLMTTEVSSGSRTESTAGGQPLKRSSSSSVKRVVNPLLREYNRHAQTVRVLAEQLALTPAGRAAYAVRREKADRGAAEDFMGDE